MAKSLDDVLSGKVEKSEAPPEPAPTETKPELAAEEPKAKTPPEPKPDKPSGDKPRDESGKFVKGEEVKTETPAVKPADKPKPANADQEALSPKEKAFYAQSQTDRQKRQDAERRYAELEQRLNAMQTPKATPDVLTDPDGFKRSITEEVETARINDRVNLSADMARDLYPDFDEVMDEWTELMRVTPLIYKQAIKQPNPAKWAYQYVKREKFLKEVGDNPDGWKKAQIEKMRTELEPELKKQLEASMPKQPVPPPSLASASSGGRVSSEPSYSGPKPFSKLFPGH